MYTKTCTLEITVISGEDLRIGGRKKSYVTVKPYSESKSGVLRTEVDKEGGRFPHWNQKLLLHFPLHCKFLKLDVLSASASASIGTAMIPASDFIGGFFPEDYLHFLSYRLSDHRGLRSGILNISVRATPPS